MNDDTGEVACVDDSNELSGRQYLWSKFLSKEEFLKCEEIFEKHKGKSTWEYKYSAYLSNESFWNMYLNNEIDLSKLEDLDELLKNEG